MRPRTANLRALAVSALLLLVVAAGLQTAPAASASRHGSRHTVTCRGPAALPGFFELTRHRNVIATRTGCASARKVVQGFSASCASAYAAQGSCSFRAAGRWRCSSRIVGPLSAGAPSEERCVGRRAGVRFEVAYFPPTELLIPRGMVAHAASGPYNEAHQPPNTHCVETGQPGSLIPPVDSSFEIHVLAGVPTTLGENLQQSLVDHRVTSILHDGLGSNPSPRVPIFLTPRDFDPGHPTGVVETTCGDPSLHAVIVRTNVPFKMVEITAAHELFHAFSVGIKSPTVNDLWWEEASATWSTGRETADWEETAWNRDLQFPNVALNTPPNDHNPYPYYAYAMSRFVQFLDARGLIGDSSWPLQREVLGGYASPGATEALASVLVNAGTTLGEQLAAFWGDRIREKPLNGPQLVPGAGKTNSEPITVTPGVRQQPAVAQSLHTEFLNFTLDSDVRRVEFQFDPGNGYFWGAVKPNESQRFYPPEHDTVSFCVAGGDENDLAWPGRFPVTFTNGSRTPSTAHGTITIRAYADASQCTNPLANRACELLNKARVQGIIGQPGLFQRTFEGRVPNGFRWQCSYHTEPTTTSAGTTRAPGNASGPPTGSLADDRPFCPPTGCTRPRGRAAVLGVERSRLPTKLVRREALKSIARSRFRTVKIGDVAGVGPVQVGVNEKDLGVTMAVGKEIYVLVASPEIHERGVLLLARRIAAQKRL